MIEPLCSPLSSKGNAHAAAGLHCPAAAAPVERQEVPLPAAASVSVPTENPQVMAAAEPVPEPVLTPVSEAARLPPPPSRPSKL